MGLIKLLLQKGGFIREGGIIWGGGLKRGFTGVFTRSLGLLPTSKGVVSHRGSTRREAKREMRETKRKTKTVLFST